MSLTQNPPRPTWPPLQEPWPPLPPTPRNGHGRLSLLLALAGFVLSWWDDTLSLVLASGATSVLCGVHGYVRLCRGEATNTAVTIAGLALGAGVIVLGLWAL